MIFSLSSKEAGDLSWTLENTDIFCFFYTSGSVGLPIESWHLAVCTSLRMKREVLLLEEPVKPIPELDTAQRWQAGEKYLWLSARSLSVFLMAGNELSVTYDSVKKTLISSK